MMQTWSGWKRFPDVNSGDHVEAPIGPGVYEVRHTMTGRVVAFGHARNVANAIAELKVNGGAGPIARLFRRSLWYRASPIWNTAPARRRAAPKPRPPRSG